MKIENLFVILVVKWSSMRMFLWCWTRLAASSRDFEYWV